MPKKILTKHWPDVARFRDIRECGKHNLPPVDLICGGFPCQDISNAGKRAGIGGERSGLWSEFARLIGELRPSYIIVENVAALLNRGISTVCGDLARMGYDAEWGIIPASAVGAYHQRKRLFIVAYTAGKRWAEGGPGRSAGGITGQANEAWGPVVADSNGARLERYRIFNQRPRKCVTWQGMEEYNWSEYLTRGERVANGIPARVDRIRGLGNAVVPQVAQYVGECVIAHYRSTQE